VEAEQQEEQERGKRKMRADEIREMSVEDIRARVTELEEERFRLRFRSATEPLENPLRLRTIRKDIARLKTVLGERERSAGSAAVAGRSAKEQSKNG
jgi:large subunit ribosomal protein L29